MIYVTVLLTWVFGVATGILLGRRSVRAAQPEPTEPKYICQCTHGYNEHLPEGRRRCNVTTIRYDAYNTVKARVNCPCQFYLGPKPPPDYTEFLKQDV